MTGLLSAFAAQVILITWRGASAGQLKSKDLPVPGMPVPANYVGAMIIYGILAALPGQAKGPAAVLGWGLVVANGLNIIPQLQPILGAYSEPGKPNQPTSKITPAATKP